MPTTIDVEITRQGVLIPFAAVDEWVKQGVEVVKDKERIILQPIPAPQTKRKRVIQVLEGAGMLVKPRWEPTTPPVSFEELEELAEKFSVGRPLSEIAIEEREERW